LLRDQPVFYRDSDGRIVLAVRYVPRETLFHCQNILDDPQGPLQFLDREHKKTPPIGGVN